MGVTGEDGDRRQLTDLTEARREQAMARWRVLRPFFEEGVPLTKLAEAAGLGERTLQRWAARYRTHGLVGLARGERTDKGRRHWPEDLRLLIEGLALRRPPPTVATIAGQVAAVADDQHRPSWESVPPAQYQGQGEQSGRRRPPARSQRRWQRRPA